MLRPRKSLVTQHHDSQALALDSLWIPLCPRLLTQRNPVSGKQQQLYFSTRVVSAWLSPLEPGEFSDSHI